jgi:hypothetical protein
VLKPWRVDRYCIPAGDRTKFVVAMERVLRAYAEPDSEERPLVCMDEAAPQVLSDEVEPVPMRPGVTRKEDYHYARHGVRSLFVFVRPFAGWRRVSARERRTARDWADEVRQLLTVDFPRARAVRLVCDNLNTHRVEALYARFGAAVGGALAERLELVYTPVNGSWLNMAELELSVLARQCTDRRFDSVAHFADEVRAWADRRNAARARIEWRFGVSDARTKLAHLYPTPTCDSLA